MASTTQFSYDRGLPSLRITKDLLESLERHLVQRIADSCGVSVDEARKSLSITIEDNFGTEHFSSVEQFHITRFSDNTKRVSVEIEAPWRSEGIRLRLRLGFSRGRISSSLSISATAPNSRELVAGLKEGVLRILEPHRTWHWVYHARAEVWGVLVPLFMLLLYAQLKLFDTPSLTFLAASLGTFLLWFYLLVLPYFRPYTVFDSRASERSDKIWSWFLKGFLTFLIFGTLLTFARRSLLGF